MEMKTVHIGDLGEIKTGSTPSKKNPDNYGDYALWIKPTDINPDEKYTRAVEEMFSEKAANDCRSRLIPAKSICVPCIGTVGTKLTMTPCDCYVNQSINAVIPNAEYDNDYVYYLLLNLLPNLKSINKGTASGREYIAKSAFENIEIQVHSDIEVQRKIGKILSAYDEMIDNCKRQIALLEEAAQRIYREWFVDLRFPGHESTPIGENGLPEGWSRSTLRDFLSIKSGKDHKILQSGNIPVYGSGGRMRYGDKAIYDKASILIPRKGSLNNILLVEGGFWTIDTMFYTEIKDENTIYFTYLQIKDWDLYAQNIGAAVPSMNTTILYSKEMIQPSIEIIGLFNNIIKPYYPQIFTLNHRLEYLIEAKDRLIPRLISGQIEINA